MQEVSQVPPLDLKRQYEPLAKEITATFERIFYSGNFVLGPDVSALEQELASYLSAKKTVGVNSGTEALWLALKAINIQPGDKVLTSPFTFFATVSAICNAGATPVFADIDPDTFNIDPEQVKKILDRDVDRKIKAIIPVHLYGQSADMTPLLSLADKYNIFVIEDACQAIGTYHLEKRVGTLGHLGAFSLFPTKNLGALGDAGFVSTNNSELADTVTLLRAHGSPIRYVHDKIGSNCRIDTLQAGIIRLFLPKLEDWIMLRQKAAAYYDEHLKFLENKIQIPLRVSYSTHTFHQYTLRVKNGKRSQLSEILTRNRIGNSVYYPIPCHLQKAISTLGYKKGDFPNSELAADEVLSLPIFPGITEAEQDYVIKTISDWAK
ncbi:MAG: DegT/DnrJ/EryC1/StrS family aminotransferase [Deltaproteobacteria bacterium]|nr:DegT/DnrJ/EryC1/StrS family aminotransferase [Deltaproteobacteria bacterium]